MKKNVKNKFLKQCLLTVIVGLFCAVTMIYTTTSVSAQSCSNSTICSLIEGLITKVTTAETNLSNNTTSLENINAKINAVDNISSDIKNAIISKNITVSDDAGLADFPELISNNLEVGVRLTYDANGATKGSVPSSFKTNKNNYVYVGVTEGTSALKKGDYAFSHWNTKADGTGENYAPYSRFKMTEDTTLYAQYKSSTD